MPIDRWALAGLILAGLLFYLLGWLVFLDTAKAHKARPAFIPKACCSPGGDCNPVTHMRQNADGSWLVITDKHRMEFSADHPLKPSMDPAGRSWACANQWHILKQSPRTYKGRCFFYGGMF